MNYNKLKQILGLITCALMLLAVAINQNQRILGYELNGETEEEVTEIGQLRNDGSIVIHTKKLAKGIMGYGGNIPLELYFKDGILVEIKPLKNAETPEFFDKLLEENFFAQWIGKSPEDALMVKADAVSGATLSSVATIETVRKGLLYMSDNGVASAIPDHSPWITPKTLLVLIVILAGCFLPMFLNSPGYRMIQLGLNVIVLGFWSGSFISYSLLVNYLSNGFNLRTSLVFVILLIAAFVFPLFGRKNHYCNWMCPLGSAQELLSKTTRYKQIISARMLKYLNYFRDALWAVLMLFMWSGVMFEWMNYELFTAFLFRQASVAVIITAVVFIALSCIVQRPYCRFVCPTGTLLRLSQNIK